MIQITRYPNSGVEEDWFQ